MQNWSKKDQMPRIILPEPNPCNSHATRCSNIQQQRAAMSRPGVRKVQQQCACRRKTSRLDYETCRQEFCASWKHVDRFMLSGPNMSTGWFVHGKTCQQLRFRNAIRSQIPCKTELPCIHAAAHAAASQHERSKQQHTPAPSSCSKPCRKTSRGRPAS